MSTNITPSESAIKERTEAESLIPIVAQKAAEHIVNQLEPRFSKEFSEGYVDTFESFVLGRPSDYMGLHSKVIDNKWFKKNRISMPYIGDVRRACQPIIKQLLEERYGIVANVTVLNGGAPEFVFDWYECRVERPRQKKRPFWHFWRR